jgi:enoyl-CoA hydratase/carnithine racemase
VDYEQIRYEVDGHVLTITLDRPERLNAATSQMIGELVDVFDRSDGDDAVRAVIVTGAGRGFCAGADLSSGGFSNVTSAREVEPVDGGGLVARRIFRSLKPVIAAVNGPAVGFGAGMTVPMDVRFASTQARFGFVQARRGIVPEACATWFLPRVVGISRALEWTMTGRVFDAQEARDAGLVREVVAPDDLLPRARELAHEIAANAAPVSVALTRQMMWRLLGAPGPESAHRAEAYGVDARARTADAQEGVAAFLEKREPAFPLVVSQDLPGLYPWDDDTTVEVTDPRR